MIGNDIVNLALAKKESNWQRKGFLDKIFTFQEQLCIKSSKNPERMVWNLWSRKEAAYKIHNRYSQLRVFNPFQLECFEEVVESNFTFGTVVCENQCYYTKTVIKSNYIYTEAVCVKEDFQKIIRISRPEKIYKIKGIPSYYDEVNSILKPISITHHGQFERIITL